MNLGPDEKIAGYIDIFLRELDDDFQAPGQSHFQDYMAKLRRDVQNMEEVRRGERTMTERVLLFSLLQSLSGDKSFIRRLIVSLKEAVRVGESKSSNVDCERSKKSCAPLRLLRQFTGPRSPPSQTTW